MQALKSSVAISALWGLSRRLYPQPKSHTYTWCSHMLTWQLCLSGENRQQPWPHRAVRESSLWCHHHWTQAHGGGTQHCPLIQTVLVIFFSSPIWRGHKIIVLRVHPNSHLLIASHYLWGANSSAGHVTAAWETVRSGGRWTQVFFSPGKTKEEGSVQGRVQDPGEKAQCFIIIHTFFSCTPFLKVFLLPIDCNKNFCGILTKILLPEKGLAYPKPSLFPPRPAPQINQGNLIKDITSLCKFYLSYK